MALDIGPVGIWTYGLWQGADDASEAVAELDVLGYGALWLGNSDGGPQTARSPAGGLPPSHPRHRDHQHLGESPTIPTGRRVLAALGPNMLRLAAERSAGVHPHLVTPAHTKKAREILGPEPLLAPEQKVVLETDPVKAREIVRPIFSPICSSRTTPTTCLTAGDYGHGPLPRQQWRDLAAALKART
jgi:hypothetical protein